MQVILIFHSLLSTHIFFIALLNQVLYKIIQHVILSGFNVATLGIRYGKFQYICKLLMYRITSFYILYWMPYERDNYWFTKTRKPSLYSCTCFVTQVYNLKMADLSRLMHTT